MKKLIVTLGVISLSLSAFFVTSEAVFAEPYGWSPQVDFSWQGTPQRTGPKLEKPPILIQPNHIVLPIKPKKGEVVLFWHKVSGATGYNIYFGLSPKNYIYSVPDVGDTNHFTIGALANRIYYFALQVKQGYSVSDLSQEWAARPGSTGSVANTNVAYRAVRAAKKKVAQKPATSQNNVVLEKSTVKGVTIEPTVEIILPTTPPAQERGQTNQGYQPPVPTPKPVSLLQKILRIFGLGR